MTLWSVIQNPVTFIYTATVFMLSVLLRQLNWVGMQDDEKDRPPCIMCMLLQNSGSKEHS